MQKSDEAPSNIKGLISLPLIVDYCTSDNYGLYICVFWYIYLFFNSTLR